jgi:hypothetical protein
MSWPYCFPSFKERTTLKVLKKTIVAKISGLGLFRLEMLFQLIFIQKHLINNVKTFLNHLPTPNQPKITEK